MAGARSSIPAAFASTRRVGQAAAALSRDRRGSRDDDRHHHVIAAVVDIGIRSAAGVPAAVALIFAVGPGKGEREPAILQLLVAGLDRAAPTSVAATPFIGITLPPTRSSDDARSPVRERASSVIRMSRSN